MRLCSSCVALPPTLLLWFLPWTISMNIWSRLPSAPSTTLQSGLLFDWKEDSESLLWLDRPLRTLSNCNAYVFLFCSYLDMTTCWHLTCPCTYIVMCVRVFTRNITMYTGVPRPWILWCVMYAFFLLSKQGMFFPRLLILNWVAFFPHLKQIMFFPRLLILNWVAFFPLSKQSRFFPQAAKTCVARRMFDIVNPSSLIAFAAWRFQHGIDTSRLHRCHVLVLTAPYWYNPSSRNDAWCSRIFFLSFRALTSVPSKSSVESDAAKCNGVQPSSCQALRVHATIEQPLQQYQQALPSSKVKIQFMITVLLLHPDASTASQQYASPALVST